MSPRLIERPAPSLTKRAQEALDASDITVLRCVEQGQAVPEAWATYRAALREVVRTGEGPLPGRPPYP